MLEPRVAVMRMRHRIRPDEIFLFQFDEEFTQFEVVAYGPIKTDFTLG